MDWSAVALLIIERAGLAAILLGPKGELLHVAPEAERQLGWRRDQIEPSSIDNYVAPGSVAHARFYLEKVATGALRKLELRVLTAQGVALARFDASAVGRESERGILLVLEHVAPIATERPLGDYDYEVTGITQGEYRLVRMWQPGFEGRPAEGKCYEVLQDRSQPCERCPLSRNETRQPLVAIGREPPHDYVLTSSRNQGDRAHVSVRRVSLASLSAVMQARLDELAQRAQLSRRERSVFGCLMDGRQNEQIASELAISPRTVKFHQANVLQKLGADSRTDLLTSGLVTRTCTRDQLCGNLPRGNLAG